MSILFEKRLIIILLVIFFGMEAVIFWPSYNFYIAFLLIGFVVLSLFKLLDIRPKEHASLPVFILPAVLIFEATIIINSISSLPLQNVFVVAVCFLLYLSFFSLEVFKKKIDSYAVIVHNILAVSGFFGAFLGFVLVYTFYVEGTVPLWLGMTMASLVSLLFFLFSLWHNDLLSRKSYVYSIVISIITMEMFWVFSFFPLLSLQLGFLLFLVYYLYKDIVVNSLKGTLTFKKIFDHTLIPSIVCIFFILSIKW